MHGTPRRTPCLLTHKNLKQGEEKQAFDAGGGGGGGREFETLEYLYTTRGNFCFKSRLTEARS